MPTFEEAFSDTEKAAEAARKAAAGVVSRARALEKAAKTGNIAAIKRGQASLRDAVTALGQESASAESCWPFTEEEERRIFDEQYADALKAAAEEKGLGMLERDGLLVSYPSILRLLPADRAVRVDRKKVSTIRPSYLVGVLLANRERSSGFRPRQFLESLYAVYGDITGATSPELLRERGGRVVPLARIYKLMTALPGASRDYNRGDFARDLYVLDSDGPRRTGNGAEVSFPSSTGTRRRSSDLFSFVGPDGHTVEYYAIRFGESAG